MVPHRALVNHATRDPAPLRPRRRPIASCSSRRSRSTWPPRRSFRPGPPAPTVVFRSGEAIGVAEFEQLLEARRPTVVNLPVRLLARVGRGALALGPLAVRRRCVWSSPEASGCCRSGSDWWRQHVAPAVRWMNGYGPTETTITATLYEPAERRPARDGHGADRAAHRQRPRSTSWTRFGGLCPIGAAGELWIGGEGVARGLPRAAGADRGAVRRRSLRAARRPRLPDGGPRSVPLRTETSSFSGAWTIRSRSGASGSSSARSSRCSSSTPRSARRPSRPGTKAPETRLAAYVVLERTPGVSTAELRAHVKERLPAYMVPSAFVVLDALPRTGSGKVDRQRLPEPGPHAGRRGGFVAPRTPLEQSVAAIWGAAAAPGARRGERQFLRPRRPLAAGDPGRLPRARGLFAGAAAAHALRVSDGRGALARDRAGAGRAGVAGRSGAPARRAREGDARLRFRPGPLTCRHERPRLAHREPVAGEAGLARGAPPDGQGARRHGGDSAPPGEEPAPLSFAQQRLWFLDQLDPGTSLYNVPEVLALRGAARRRRARAGAPGVVERHEVLRTPLRRRQRRAGRRRRRTRSLPARDGPVRAPGGAPRGRGPSARGGRRRDALRSRAGARSSARACCGSRPTSTGSC